MFIKMKYDSKTNLENRVLVRGPKPNKITFVRKRGKQSGCV
jgi:hypothetical protein